MQSAAVTAWHDTLSDIKELVGEVRFNLWFRRTRALCSKEAAFEVGVPSVFSAEWLDNHYRDVITCTLSEKLGRAVAIRFVVDPGLFREEREKQGRSDTDLIRQAGAPENIEKSDPVRYSLDNFVVGPCNSVAYWACVKVAQNPATAYNPLFIHGGVGLGKTHLLRAVAGAVRGGEQSGDIEYISAESFTNQFLFALRNNKMHAFHRRYRNCRILVIDDVHFLASKQGTQEEFLNTYKAVSRHGGQIIMASDSHPKLIGKLKDELVTRFLAGMVVKIEKPDFNTRLEIVRRKAAERSLALADATAEFVARNVSGSVRELEGAVNTIAWYAAMSCAPVGVSMAGRILDGLIESQCLPVRLAGIDELVTRYAGLAEGDLRGKRRTRPVSRARHLAMYLARELGSYSYSEIGAYFGGRNHSSVLSAVRKVEELIDTDEAFSVDVAALKSQFGS